MVVVGEDHLPSSTPMRRRPSARVACVEFIVITSGIPLILVDVGKGRMMPPTLPGLRGDSIGAK